MNKTPAWIQIPALVIGLGNYARGDDAAGLLAARRVREAKPPRVPVFLCPGDCSRLLEMWSGAEHVLLIDAVSSGAEPGTIHRWDLKTDPLESSWFSLSTHAFGLLDAIALGRALKQFPENMWIYGIEGKRFETGAEPSPEVRSAIGAVARRVVADIQAITGKRESEGPEA